MQVWSGSSDGSIAVTDIDAAGRLDTALARSLKTPSGKGAPAALCTDLVFAETVYVSSKVTAATRIVVLCPRHSRPQHDFSQALHCLGEHKHPAGLICCVDVSCCWTAFLFCSLGVQQSYMIPGHLL